MKPKLKNYKYIENPDLGEENPLMIRWFFGVIIATIVLWFLLIFIIVKYADFFDSPVVGYVLTVVLGLPIVWLSIVRMYNQFIK